MNTSEQLSPRPATSRSGLVYVVGVVLVATLGGLLFGYDTAVIAGAISFLEERFLQTPQLHPQWLSWLEDLGILENNPQEIRALLVGWATSCALLGCVLGVSVSGWLNDRFGRKKVLLLSAVLFLISALGTALPRTFTEFILFRLLGGIGVGAASMTSPMYIAEIAPAHLRGRLVSLNQLAIVSGMLLVYFVNYFIAQQGDLAWNIDVGWRWMFGSEAIPALLLLVLMCFVPESPRFLVKQGQADRAYQVLRRAGRTGGAVRELEEIRTSLAQESGSLRQLLQPGFRVVLFVGIALAVLQQVTGINVFLYYAPQIFEKIAGSDANIALLQTIVVGAANLVFTLVAIMTVDRWGRKPLMILGASGMGISLTVMGFAAFTGQTGAWILACILAYIGSFALAVGPVTWVILSEIFPTRIRGRALSIATIFLWSANLLVSQTFPMLDRHPWLVERFHHAFPFWLYASLCFVLVLVVALLVPETKGRSLEEIEKMWHQDRRATRT